MTVSTYDILRAYAEDVMKSITLKSAYKWMMTNRKPIPGPNGGRLGHGTSLFIDIMDGRVAVVDIHIYVSQLEVDVSLSTNYGAVERGVRGMDLRDPDFGRKFHKTIIELLRKVDLLASWNAMLAEWDAKR